MPRIMNKTIWPHQITFDPCDFDVWGNRKNWLRDNFSKQPESYYINGDTYCFRNQRDLIHFSLVWQ